MPAVDAAEEGVFRIEIIGRAEAAHEELFVAGCVHARRRGVLELEMLIADAGTEGEGADLDFILKIQRGGEDLLKACRSDRSGRSRSEATGSVRGVEDLLVGAARAVVVEAESDGDVVGYGAGVEAKIGLVLPAV